MDKFGNVNASEGCDRCYCGGKYWENDYCVACGVSYERNWLRLFGTASLLAAEQVTAWNMDALRVNVGQAEVVPWPDVETERWMRRGGQPVADPGVRVVIQAGKVFLVKDVV